MNVKKLFLASVISVMVVFSCTATADTTESEVPSVSSHKQHFFQITKIAFTLIGGTVNFENEVMLEVIVPGKNRGKWYIPYHFAYRKALSLAKTKEERILLSSMMIHGVRPPVNLQEKIFLSRYAVGLLLFSGVPFLSVEVQCRHCIH